MEEEDRHSEDWPLNHPDEDAPEWEEPRPDAAYEIDEREKVNGAWRSIDGRFFQLPSRTFYADGRKTLDADHYLELLAEIELQPRQRPSAVSPTEALRTIRSLRAALDELEYEAVAIARGYGWSWRDIADELRVSRSAAHRRFAKVDVLPRQRRRNGS
jgi:DNA-directed RNA polymerase specialized sigma24 family protein